MPVKLSATGTGSVTLTSVANPGADYTATFPANTGNVVTTGSSGVVTGTMLASATVAPSNLSQPLTAGTAQASTSGTAITFTGIPSWVKRITIILNNISTSGTANILFQVGSGSITSSGYASSTALVYGTNNTLTSSSTAGFISFSNAASNNIIGTVVLTTVGSNIWVSTNINTTQTNGQIVYGAGVVTLSGTLDRVSVTTSNGTDTFDQGSINILYE